MALMYMTGLYDKREVAVGYDLVKSEKKIGICFLGAGHGGQIEYKSGQKIWMGF